MLLCAAYLQVHLLINEEIPASFPLSSLHSLAGLHHVLSHALWGTNQRLPFTDSQHVMEVLTNHTSLRVQLMSYSQIWANLMAWAPRCMQTSLQTEYVELGVKLYATSITKSYQKREPQHWIQLLCHSALLLHYSYTTLLQFPYETSGSRSNAAPFPLWINI